METEQQKEQKWKKTGKGRGNRWLMVRDLLAILAMRPMSNNLIQETMFLHRGLKRATVREMLEQLERTKSIEQVEDVTGSINSWAWVATEGGVHYWITSRKDIPASIVKVATILKSVSSYGR